ncbi:MAG TPA: non-canonical purine NTP pyrophosphatase [Candidatus Dormibacteraeota bacterium]|nr:non-canonical purine NTP pyrophosphatase [Candidatus Dormibacteraeota bacterium]
MTTYVATSNSGKLHELQTIFAGSTLELATFPGYVAVPEGDSSYTENALRKARGLQRQLREAGIAAWVLADDSGLEVAALGGRPGVLSARYAGEDASWAERRKHLLDELRGLPVSARGARFVSHVALVHADGSELVAAGVVDGSIATEELGAGGFGYDPVFFYPPAGTTFAQMSEEAKNRCSHRRLAADHLLGLLDMHVR